MHYVIDLVAVGFTRELGPLLTAIAVSGRSGSAFSAEIGTMMVTEEVDALRVMAFEPIEFVPAPKYLAMNQQSRNVTTEAKVGAFVLACLAILAFTLVYLLNAQFRGGGVPYRTYFAMANRAGRQYPDSLIK